MSSTPVNPLKLLALAVCLCVLSCIFFTGGAEVAETVYFLPKDNVDIAKNPDRDYLIVGFSQPIPEEYIEALQPDLVYLPNYVDGDTMAVEKAAYLAFTRLQWDLRNKYGINVALYDGYRTVADQQWLIESGLATYTTGQPGYSEHHTGLLLDIIVEVGEYYYSELAVLTDESVPEEVKSSTAFNTLHEILPDYGFIIRYPKGKESYTGIAYNPSEIRFVGSKEVAHAIMDNNLCLEEYISTLTP